MKNRLWKNIEAELHVLVNMDEVHEVVEEPREEFYDVMKEYRKEEIELQVQEDKPCVDEDITTLNGWNPYFIDDDDDDDVIEAEEVYDHQEVPTAPVMPLMDRAKVETHEDESE
ncbi:unnamed protein product [Lactuca virosa]|uniref:Uncharacterized protein n=1 Tax=Lactuca virosa TaxID=75947 RepID=A0AAU9NEL0_9ASTR|nr:unnamed protein product [Lactuca virosa]